MRKNGTKSSLRAALIYMLVYTCTCTCTCIRCYVCQHVHVTRHMVSRNLNCKSTFNYTCGNLHVQQIKFRLQMAQHYTCNTNSELVSYIHHTCSMYMYMYVRTHNHTIISHNHNHMNHTIISHNHNHMNHTIISYNTIT